jgi:hypothetical protein
VVSDMAMAASHSTVSSRLADRASRRQADSINRRVLVGASSVRVQWDTAIELNTHAGAAVAPLVRTCRNRTACRALRNSGRRYTGTGVVKHSPSPSPDAAVIALSVEVS